MEALFYYFISYLTVFFVNRWIFMQIQKAEGTGNVNPFGVLYCFFFLLGTALLLIIWLMVSEVKSDFFKYKK